MSLISRESAPRARNLLARGLKLIGALTDPKATPTGKVFDAVEKGLTSALGKLAGSDRYLDFAGRMMERSFAFQTDVARSRETLLRALRLPTTSEVDAMRDQIRKVSDQNEALSLQLEVLLERLEAAQSKDQAGT